MLQSPPVHKETFVSLTLAPSVSLDPSEQALQRSLLPVTERWRACQDFFNTFLPIQERLLGVAMMYCEGLVVIAKGRNLSAKEVLRFLENAQKEQKREHEAIVARLKEQLHQAEQGMRFRSKETCLNLPEVQSVEFSECEGEVSVGKFR